ncbi:hypothetical protein AAE02nite_05680 [Adhaeribacter aerolatus]|uniref:Uncharacterized protein n=1 Tax=Adhaeribacter aerolatus TaxID=670289 RepID=A0A512AT70_9BACT|nr:pinensin family lanthipeptide [Adhaeribacter aerolatus]GEO02904.1 hypothetical protein AAE02nite_05680 [Adhaeribacter aerolatus]
MKNQKLNLDELKVQSFVTDFNKEQEQTQDVNGGGTGYNFCYYVPVNTTRFVDIWSLQCSYGCEFTSKQISDVINPVVRY